MPGVIDYTLPIECALASFPGSPRVYISRSGEPGNEAKCAPHCNVLVSFPDHIFHAHSAETNLGVRLEMLIMYAWLSLYMTK